MRHPLRLAASSVALSAYVLMAGCAGSGGEPFSPRPRPTADFPNISYATWTDAEPPYRFYPGDEVEVTVGSAPELNKQVIVGPDGRISLPLIRPIMVADRTADEVSAALTQAYSADLVNPNVGISVRTAQPLRVFIGGDVAKAGVYDMPGDIDALQAVIQAGGFLNTARRDKVIVIRRGPDGRPMMRTVDLRRGVYNPASTDTVPLRRFDVVYVPKTGIAEAGLFVQQYMRDLLPVSVGFSYALNPQVYSSAASGAAAALAK
jgi:protein involved in polysaccharide export with SLBB domain